MELLQHGRSGSLPTHRDTRGFRDALNYARDHREKLSAGALKEIHAWDWPKRSQWFYALFRQIVQGNIPAPFSYINTRPCEVK